MRKATRAGTATALERLRVGLNALRTSKDTYPHALCPPTPHAGVRLLLKEGGVVRVHMRAIRTKDVHPLSRTVGSHCEIDSPCPSNHPSPRPYLRIFPFARWRAPQLCGRLLCIESCCREERRFEGDDFRVRRTVTRTLFCNILRRVSGSSGEGSGRTKKTQQYKAGAKRQVAGR
ncbi:hypothetical protein C8J57DRAFT_1347865 [Mycena rebaudengoi]|nr:hypothetical protein C8J57DRAFT_1347865 [Mycena rebaudengoi]